MQIPVNRISRGPVPWRKKGSRIRTQGGFMKYVDGYVLPVPKKNLVAYRRIAQQAGKLWRKYGALEFRECVGDHLKTQKIKSFPALVKPKRGETIVFSWITFKSRAPSRQCQRQSNERPRDRENDERKKCPSIRSAWPMADSRSW
jgi:Uncharacterized conserved protein